MNYRRQTATFHFEEDPFRKIAERIKKSYLEVLMLMIFLQTKPQVKGIDINYYDLYYTVFKNRDKKEILIDKHENDECDCVSFDKFFLPNHFIGSKPHETILSLRKVWF